MADEPKKVMAGDFSGLPLKALIGAPLKATADANAMLARSQTQFLLSTCFDSVDGKLRPKILNFNLERSVVNADGTLADEKASMEISIPLMTLIPMNSLAVQELNVAFEMEVKNSTEYIHKSQSQQKNEATGDISSPYESDKFSVEMHGTLARSRKSESSGSSAVKDNSSARYEITMKAGQLPLAKGITTIIDMFAKGIAPIQLKATDDKGSDE